MLWRSGSFPLEWQGARVHNELPRIGLARTLSSHAVNKVVASTQDPHHGGNMRICLRMMIVDGKERAVERPSAEFHQAGTETSENAEKALVGVEAGRELERGEEPPGELVENHPPGFVAGQSLEMRLSGGARGGWRTCR